MAEKEPLFRITNEEDAWRTFAEAFKNGLPEGAQPTIVWDGWPNIEIYLPNTPEEGSISTSMMEAFLELQKSIYRSHALLSTGSDNLRHLKNVEREQFELRVKVEKGSSGYNIDLTKILSQLGNNVVAKMSGTELIIVVLGVSLVIAGVISWKAYLKHKTEIKRVQVDDERTKQLLDNYKTQLAHDTERYTMLTEAIAQRPILKQIETTTNDARDEIIKAVADESGGKIMNVSLAKDVATEISSINRQQSSETTTTGTYRVAKVDTTALDGFKVTFEDIKTDEQVTASLVDALISAEHKIAIQEAEWNKRPVIVELKGRRLRGKWIEAKITSVRQPS